MAPHPFAHLSLLRNPLRTVLAVKGSLHVNYLGKAFPGHLHMRYRWRLFHEGPEFRKFGNAVRYPADALEAWIERTPRGGGSKTRVSESKWAQ
jgi:hypothetical protein